MSRRPPGLQCTDLSEIKIYIGVDKRQVPCITGVRVRCVQEDERGLWVCLDDGLHVCRGRQRQCDVVVPQASVELHYIERQMSLLVENKV